MYKSLPGSVDERCEEKIFVITGKRETPILTSVVEIVILSFRWEKGSFKVHLTSAVEEIDDLNEKRPTPNFFRALKPIMNLLLIFTTKSTCMNLYLFMYYIEIGHIFVLAWLFFSLSPARDEEPLLSVCCPIRNCTVG